jgi:hypothetical protein
MTEGKVNTQEQEGVAQSHICLLYWGHKSCLLHAGFFLGLLFNPEDGDDIFLRNIG